MGTIIQHIEDRTLFNLTILSNKLHYSDKSRSGILTAKKLTNMRIAVVDGKCVGCSCSSEKLSCLVYVLPFYRHQGIGTKLIEGMETKKVDKRTSLKKFWKT